MSLLTLMQRPRSYLVFLIILGGSVWSVAKAAQPVNETAATATSVSATLAWADVTRLSTPVSGVVAVLPVQPGQVVAKGSVLLRLDRAPFLDRLAAINAERAGLVRAAAEAKRDAERTQQLFDRTVASESERQEALIKQEKTQAQLNATKARADLRGWDLARSELVAPFSARILSVDTAVGETVSSELNAPVLLRIARADVINAEATLNPSAAVGIQLGQTLTVHVDQSTVSGQVIALVSEPAVNGARYRLLVQLKPAKGWIAGLPARIDLP